MAQNTSVSNTNVYCHTLSVRSKNCTKWCIKSDSDPPDTAHCKMFKPIKVSELDVSKFSFGIKPSTYGHFIIVKYAGNQNFAIQTPKMFTTGVKGFSLKEGGPITSYILPLNFDNDAVMDLRNKLVELQGCIRQFIFNNSATLFGKAYTEEQFDLVVSITPIVRPPYKEGYSESITLKLEAETDNDRFIANKRDNIPLQVFDKHRNAIDFKPSNAQNVIPFKSDVICLFEIPYLFVNKSKVVSPRCQLTQAKVFKEEIIYNKYAIDDPEDDDVVMGNSAIDNVAEDIDCEIDDI